VRLTHCCCCFKRKPGRPPQASKKATPTARQKTKDGRSASQVVRDFDSKYPGRPAADVISHCAKLGLDVAPSLIYNVRQNIKKAKKTSKKKTGKK
jgi:hypothetical protein